MASFLTLNTHSLMGENIEAKLQSLGEMILKKDCDVVCLQEINQEKDSPVIGPIDNFCPVPDQFPLHEDNYALALVRYLKDKGANYYFSYAYNHIGYDHFNEGVAILAKEPLESQSFVVSKTDDPTDYHTRRILVSKTQINGQELYAVSAHFSWLKDGFLAEWQKAVQALAQKHPLVVMGDFNNPAQTKGYQAILDSELGLQDTYQAARKKSGGPTIEADIDGWEGNSEALRIDFIFATAEFEPVLSEVVFDGQTGPVISDHRGVFCQTK